MLRSFIYIVLVSSTAALTRTYINCDDRSLCSWCEWSEWGYCNYASGTGIKQRNRHVKRDLEWKNGDEVKKHCALSDIKQTEQRICEKKNDNPLIHRGIQEDSPFQDKKEAYAYLQTRRQKRSLYEECTESGTCSFEEVREKLGSSQVCNYMKNWKCGQCSSSQVCVVVNTNGCSRLSSYHAQCKVDCGPPPTVPFSTYSSTGTTLYGDVVTYACDVNAQLEGNPQTTCLYTGHWSSSNVYCRELYPLIDIKGTVIAGLRQVKQTTRLGESEIDELFFECKFMPPVSTSYLYDIHWYINSKNASVISFTNVEAGNLTATPLLEAHWKTTHQMNMVVYCSTQVRYNITSTQSPHSWSNGLEAGIKTDKSLYAVKETETLKINLYLTVPLGCIKPDGNSTYEYQRCTLNVLTATPNYQRNPTKYCGSTADTSGSGLIFNSQNCGVYFPADNWTLHVPLEVTGEIDGLYNSANRMASIRLKTQHGIFDIWKDLKIPDIQVYIIDEESQKVKNKACTLFNDPHITPFEMKNGFYDHFLFGEYVVYKHLSLPVQINAVFAKCFSYGHATCICAIAIRNDDGLFVINMCQENLEVYTPSTLNRFNRYIEKSFCDDVHMTLRKEGPSYIVEFPSGTKVVIKVGRKFINSFTIKASALDYDDIVGLCGPLDGKGFRRTLSDKTVTLDEEEFKRHYFVPDNESLLAVNWKPPSTSVNLSVNLQQYCVCRINGTANTAPVDSSYMLCELTQPVEKCSSKTTPQSEVFYETCSKSRTKRSTRYSQEKINGPFLKNIQSPFTHVLHKRDVDIDGESFEKFPILPYNLSNYSPNNISWHNGWTENKAYSHCENAFAQTPAYITCTNMIPGVNVTLFIDACVRDIKISGNDSWLSNSIHAYKTACGVEAVMEESLRDPKSANNKTFLDELLDSSCLNDCTGHGLCVAGECRCDDGYFEDDCSKEFTSTPNVAKESMTGLCDNTKQSCNKVLIPGDGFNPNGIKCSLRSIQVTKDGAVTSSLRTVDDGEYLNTFSCQCKLPSRRRRSTSSNIIASGYMISVANGNGSGTYSEEITMLIYNGNCFTCNSTSMTCERKFGTNCAENDAVISKNGTDETSTEVTIIIIGTIVLCAALIVGTIIVIKWKRKNRHKHHDDAHSGKNSRPETVAENIYDEIPRGSEISLRDYDSIFTAFSGKNIPPNDTNIK